jgi:RimJ/RimL family protein N-acetyltransferase
MNLNYKVIDKNTSALGFIDDLLALTALVDANNAAPYLCPPDRDFYERSLAIGSAKVLVFDDDKVVGFSAIHFLRQWPDYLEQQFENEAYPCQHCALVWFTLVHPDYRGLGINKKMTQLRLSEAAKVGVKYLIATVHPDNIPSLRMLQSLGMKQIDQRVMFD